MVTSLQNVKFYLTNEWNDVVALQTLFARIRDKFHEFAELNCFIFVNWKSFDSILFTIFQHFFHGKFF